MPVIPANLVAKIQSGDFVDMAELPKGNIELERRKKAHGPNLGDVCSSKSSRREVPDLLSWVQCFGV